MKILYYFLFLCVIFALLVINIGMEQGWISAYAFDLFKVIATITEF